VSREELATTRLVTIDVEDAEDRVFAGMLACLARSRPIRNRWSNCRQLGEAIRNYALSMCCALA
jgi:hypothetical protein